MEEILKSVLILLILYAPFYLICKLYAPKGSIDDGIPHRIDASQHSNIPVGDLMSAGIIASSFDSSDDYNHLEHSVKAFCVLEMDSDWLTANEHSAIGISSDMLADDFNITNTNSDWAVNIDGSPMCGDLDIHGNPYGVTSDF